MNRCIILIFIIFIICTIPDYSQEWVNICPSFIPDDIYGLDGVFINKYTGWVIGIGELPQKFYRTIDVAKT